MKKVLFIGALFIALAGLMTGCSSTSIIKEFDEKGNLVKQTETKESVVDQVIASTKDKSVWVYEEGWLGAVRATVVSTDNPTPVLEILATKKNRGVVTIHKDQKDMDKLEGIFKACKSTESLSLSGTGISSSGAD